MAGVRERNRPLPRDRPAELAGEWWDPSEPEQLAYGRLTYSPDDGLELHLTAGADVLRFDAPVPWVQGVTVHGRRVTLRNCIVRNWSLNVPGGVEARAFVEQAFVGIHAASDRELRFDDLYARMVSLGDWLETSGFDLPGRGGPPTRYEYSPPNPVPLVRTGGAMLTASFDFAGEARPRRSPYGITVEQRAWLSVRPRTRRRFIELNELVLRFNRLLSFACSRDCPILEMSGMARVPVVDFAGRTSTQREEVWVLEARPSVETEPQDAARMLFRYGDVEARRLLPILRWFRRAPELEAVARVYLAGLPTRTLDPEARFLAYVQALEAYERYRRPKGRRNLETRLDNLVSALPRGVRRLVPSSFAELAANTRDYFSHRIPQLEARAARDEQLFALIWASKVLFDLTMLRELGFGQTQIQQWALDGNQRLAREIERGFVALGV